MTKYTEESTIMLPSLKRKTQLKAMHQVAMLGNSIYKLDLST